MNKKITQTLQDVKNNVQYLFSAWKNDCYHSDYTMDMYNVMNDIDELIGKEVKPKYIYHYHAKRQNGAYSEIIDGIYETYFPIASMDRYRQAKKAIFEETSHDGIQITSLSLLEKIIE